MNILKQLAGLVTDLRRKFDADVFRASRIKILLFVVLLTITIVLIFTALIDYIERLIYISVMEALNTAIATGFVDPATLQGTSVTTDRAFIFILVTVIALATIAGSIAARVALRPITHALDLQKRFIGSAAHELRTPLAILKTNNEVALYDVAKNNPLRTLLEENVEDVNHLTEIINNLMLLHRTNAFGPLTFEKVDIEHVLARIMKQLTPLADARGITVAVREKSLPIVYGNTTALEQVFFNLIKNAIVYTPENGTVTVSSGPLSPTIASIQVSDTGVGIAKTDFPHIFEPFYRSEKTAYEKGSGLGLAIVFEIVRHHSGKIMIQSAPEQGTSFIVSLPRYNSQHIEETTNKKGAVQYDFSK